MEPLACVVKSIRLSLNQNSGQQDTEQNIAVVGLGVMGLLHMKALNMFRPVGFDLNQSRREWASSIGLTAAHPDEATQESFRTIYVCPGSQAAFDFAIRIAEPEATIVMFAPLAPGENLQVPQSAYFKDLKILNSYSCGPEDTALALNLLELGAVKASDVISNFITLEDLPAKYLEMKKAKILKPMVVFT